MKSAAPTRRPGRLHRSSLMNVGRRMDYAVRALCYLTAQPTDRVVSRTEIQERQRIPPHFLSKILRKLVADGILVSAPGARGGFRVRDAERRLSLREVYESIEGPLCLMECIDEDEFCCFAPVCTQITVWRGMQMALGHYLEQVSIRDIADQRGLVPRLSDLYESPGRSQGQAERS